MTKEEIGQLIKRERLDQKLSQKKLAELAGLKRYQQIMEIENSEHDYGFDALWKVLQALGITIILNSQKANEDASLNVYDFSKVESAT